VLRSDLPNDFRSGSSAFECLVFTFRRVSVRPTAYAFRTDGWALPMNPGWGYVFQGLAPNGRWVTLDERVGEPRFGSRTTVNTVDTALAFRKFRLFTATVPVPGVPSMIISAFDIHGTVFLDAALDVGGSITCAEFDPWLIRECE
jgi:hypothetical protein